MCILVRNWTIITLNYHSITRNLGETETCNVTSYTVIQTFFHRILRNYQVGIGYSDGGCTRGVRGRKREGRLILCIKVH